MPIVGETYNESARFFAMWARLTRYVLEQPATRGYTHPALCQCRFDPLESPEMVEQAIILDHRFSIEDSVERSFDPIFQGETVPADLAMRVFQDPCIQPAKHVRRIILRIRRPDGRFEVGCEMMSIQADRGLAQARSEVSVTDSTARRDAR